LFGGVPGRRLLVSRQHDERARSTTPEAFWLKADG
jgi:hypothetical protein